MSSYNPNRVAAGKSDGGQFAAKVNGEQDINLDLPSDADTFNDPYAALAAEGNKPVTLHYVNYDDQLTDEQVENALRGNWDEVQNEVYENFSDAAYSEAREIAEGEVNFLHSEGKFHAEWDDLDEDQQAEAIRAVQERDESDPVGDLLKKTHDRDLRFNVQHLGDTARGMGFDKLRDSLEHDIDDVLGDDDEGKYTEDRVKLLKGILSKNGVDGSDENVDKSLRKFVDEGYSNWGDINVDVVWRGSIDEVTPNTPENQNDVAGREISIRNPELVMRYGRESEASSVALPVPIKTAVGGGHYFVELDENPYGYDRNPSYVDTEGWRYYRSQDEAAV